MNEIIAVIRYDQKYDSETCQRIDSCLEKHQQEWASVVLEKIAKPRLDQNSAIHEVVVIEKYNTGLQAAGEDVHCVRTASMESNRRSSPRVMIDYGRNSQVQTPNLDFS